jgi:hypothetical protein
MTTKPQSIVHHVIRLERKITRVFLKTRGRFGRQEQEKAVERLPSSLFMAEKPSIRDDETVSTAAANTLVHEYRTINQIEFMTDCLTNTNGSFLVHFYVEDSFVSENIDKRMEQLAVAQSRYHCLRINSRLAPLMTAKLNIEKERPTVVAIEDGLVVSRISELFSSPDC